MRLTLLGRIPSKKNSRTMIFRSGNRPLSIPSANYSKWHKDASLQLKQFAKPKKPIELCAMKLDFYFPDKRTRDLTNAAESIMDLLVDADFLFDDAWQVVYRLLLTAKGVDKVNPRCVITIDSI